MNFFNNFLSNEVMCNRELHAIYERIIKKDNLKYNFIKKYQQEKDNIFILKERIEFRNCKEKF